eukprot:20396-Heterococcus_DN1.PRE.1
MYCVLMYSSACITLCNTVLMCACNSSVHAIQCALLCQNLVQVAALSSKKLDLRCSLLEQPVIVATACIVYSTSSALQRLLFDHTELRGCGSETAVVISHSRAK